MGRCSQKDRFFFFFFFPFGFRSWSFSGDDFCFVVFLLLLFLVYGVGWKDGCMFQTEMRRCENVIVLDFLFFLFFF